MTDVTVPQISRDLMVGRRVGRLMDEQGLTQTALAPRLGMDQSALGKRLRGQLGWSVDNLLTAARELGVSVGHLVGENEQNSEIPWGASVEAAVLADGSLATALRRVEEALMGFTKPDRAAYQMLFRQQSVDDLHQTDVARAWLLLTAVGQFPADYGIPDRVVNHPFEPSFVRNQIEKLRAGGEEADEIRATGALLNRGPRNP